MCKVCHKILPIIIILIALLLAIAISVWHEQGLTYIVFVSRFFDVMLPVLAVGALIKYLLSYPHVCKSVEENSGCQHEKKD